MTKSPEQKAIDAAEKEIAVKRKRWDKEQQSMEEGLAKMTDEVKAARAAREQEKAKRRGRTKPEVSHSSD